MPKKNTEEEKAVLSLKEPETDLKVGDYVKWGIPVQFGRITFVSKKSVMSLIPMMANILDSYGCLITTVPTNMLTKITEAEYLGAWRGQLKTGDIVRYKDGCQVRIEKIRDTLGSNHMRMEPGAQVYVGGMLPPSPGEIAQYVAKERLKAELEHEKKKEQSIKEKANESFDAWAKDKIEDGRRYADIYAKIHDQLLKSYKNWGMSTPKMRAEAQAVIIMEIVQHPEKFTLLDVDTFQWQNIDGTTKDISVPNTRDHIAESAAFLADKIKRDDRTQEFYIHNASLYLKVKDWTKPVFWEEVEFAKITCETIEATEAGGLLSTEKKELQHCENPEHRGLTFRCPRRKPDTVCVVCLACDAESGDDQCGCAIYDVVDDGDGNIEYKNFRMIEDDEEWRSIPEIPLDVYCYMMRLADHTDKAQPEDPPTSAPAEAKPGNKKKKNKKKTEEDKGAGK